MHTPSPLDCQAALTQIQNIDNEALRNFLCSIVHKIQASGIPSSHIESIVFSMSLIQYGPLSPDLMNFTVRFINSMEPEKLESIKEGSDYLNFMLTTADIGYNLFSEGL